MTSDIVIVTDGTSLRAIGERRVRRWLLVTLEATAARRHLAGRVMARLPRLRDGRASETPDWAAVGVIEPWLRGGAAGIARRVLGPDFDHLVPAAEAMPGGFRVLPELQEAWRRAAALGAVEALALAAQVQEVVLELRAAELRRAPLSTALYEAVLERLGPLGSALPPRELDAVPGRRLPPGLAGAARRLERASRRPRPLLRDRVVRRARASVLRELRPLRDELEEVLGCHLAALAATALADRVIRWRENVRASRAVAAKPGAAGGDRSLRTLEVAAVRAYARTREPALLGAGASPRPAFWAAFGAWLGARSWLAPDLGPAAFQEALRAFVDELAARIFPGDLALAGVRPAAGPTRATPGRRRGRPGS